MWTSLTFARAFAYRTESTVCRTRFTILDYNRSVHYNTGDDFHILYATLCLNINIFSHFIKFHSTPLTTNNWFTHLPSLKLFPLFRPSLKISNVVMYSSISSKYLCNNGTSLLLIHSKYRSVPVQLYLSLVVDLRTNVMAFSFPLSPHLHLTISCYIALRYVSILAYNDT